MSRHRTGGRKAAGVGWTSGPWAGGCRRRGSNAWVGAAGEGRTRGRMRPAARDERMQPAVRDERRVSRRRHTRRRGRSAARFDHSRPATSSGLAPGRYRSASQTVARARVTCGTWRRGRRAGRRDPSPRRCTRGSVRSDDPLAGRRPRSTAQCAPCRDARSDGPPARGHRIVGGRAGGVVLHLRRAWRDRHPWLACRGSAAARHRAEDRARRHQRADGHPGSQATPGGADRTCAGWAAINVGVWLVVADTRTNRRALATHATALRTKYPADGRTIRSWLRHPEGRVLALSFLPHDAVTTIGRGTRPIRRVARPTRAVAPRP
jgi:hypothetical protein